MYRINLRPPNLQKEKELVLPQMRIPACDVLCSCGIVAHLEMTVTRATKVTGRVECREKTLESKRGQKANRFSGFNPVVFLLFSSE